MAKRAGLRVVEDEGTGYLEPDAKKVLLNRLARLEGHLRAVRRMLDEGRCADEILLQVSAVKAALNTFSAVLLEHELKSCVNSCMQGDENERLDRITRVMAALLKQG